MANEVARSMQINIDLTIAMHCEKLSANVLDKSLDRLIASELLELQKVEFGDALAHSDLIRVDLLEDDQKHGNGNGDGNGDEDEDGNGDTGTFGKPTKKKKKNSVNVNLRRETLHGVLKRAKRARHFSKRKENVHGQACRIFGSFPVTKVQGDFHIISKEFFLRSFKKEEACKCFCVFVW